MSEGSRDETTHRHLTHSSSTDAGERNLALQPGDRVFDRCCMRRFDLAGDVGGSERPQHRDRLDRGESEVVAGDCLGELSGLDRQEPGQFPVVVRCPIVLVAEPGGTDLGTDPGSLGGGDRSAPMPTARDVVLGEGLCDDGLERGCPRVDREESAKPARGLSL